MDEDKIIEALDEVEKVLLKQGFTVGEYRVALEMLKERFDNTVAGLRITIDE